MPTWFRTAKKSRKPRLGKPLTRRLRAETLEARNMLAAVIVDDGDAGFSASLPTITLDDGSSCYAESGTWYTSGLGGVDGDSRYAHENSAKATYTFSDLTPGDYLLEVNTPAHATSTNSAKYTITSGVQSSIRTVDQIPGTGGWLSLGSFTAYQASINVVVSQNGTGALRADGLRLVPISGFATSALGGYEGDSLWSYQGSATYQFTGLTPGVNEISVEMPQHFTSTTAALYTITSGSSTYTTTFNQQASNLGWNSLGSYILDTTATVTVSFTNGPGNAAALRADAIRITSGKPTVIFGSDKYIVRGDTGSETVTVAVTVDLSHSTNADDSGSFRTVPLTAKDVDSPENGPKDFDAIDLEKAFEPGIFASHQTNTFLNVRTYGTSDNEVSKRFKLEMYDLSTELEPGITTTHITLLGINLSIDSNYDGTVEPSRFGTDANDAKSALVQTREKVRLDIGDATDIAGYRVVLTKSSGDLKLYSASTGNAEIAESYVVGEDDIPAEFWVESSVAAELTLKASIQLPHVAVDHAIDELTLQYIDIGSIRQVEFFDNLALVSDPASNGSTVDYTAESEWYDANGNGSLADAGDRRYPLAYVRGSQLWATVELGIENGAHPGMQGRGVASNGVDLEYASAMTVENGIATFTVSGELSDKVAYLDDFEITWQISIDDGITWNDAGVTTHALYQTYDEPLGGSTLFHSVVHLGSAFGLDADSEAETVNNLWDNFTDLNVKTIEVTSTWSVIDGDRISYWGPVVAGDPSLGGTTADLLRYNDGRCGGWADLLKAVLEAQGIGSTVKAILPKQLELPNTAVQGILVHNVVFDESAEILIGEGRFIYPESAVDDAAGVAGQSNANPQSRFIDHAVVSIDGKLYDPSYGKLYNDLNAWEDAALAGIGFQHFNPTNGIVTRYMIKQTVGTEDTNLI